MPEITDPVPAPEPGEGVTLRGKDLKNVPVILRPTGHRTEPGKDGKTWEFVECDVWVLDRSGVVQQANRVRISWWRAVAQLRECIGAYVACRPTEQDDNSVTLERLSGAAREVAAKVVAGFDVPVEGVPDETPPWDEDESPF